MFEVLLKQSETRQKKIEPISIVIADDHTIFRDALRSLLEDRFSVIGEAADGDEVVNAVTRLKPDILLLDLNMPRCNGLEALKKLAALKTSVRTLLLTAEIDRAQMVEALLMGASGVLLKDTNPLLLVKAIHTVMNGQYWIGRESVNEVIDVLRDLASSVRSEQRKDKFGLTPRELEIVQALAAGEVNKEIARRLAISDQTVKHHLTNIFNKLGVSQRLEVVLFAMKHDLINVTPQRTKERTVVSSLQD
jgi:two-component system nitrate/nitrite response regulator NarL